MIATAEPRFEPIDRIAQRVLGGDMVFFIGAGFSIDSEGNTAGRLIARLLARLLAMGTCLAQSATDDQPSQARAVLEGLGRVFKLERATQPGDQRLEPVRCMTDANVASLARDYYNFNEWSVSALGVLSREMLDPSCTVRPDAVHRLENYLRESLGSDPVPIDPLDWDTLQRFERDADLGKAVFLDTMGFANQRIMAGKPADTSLGCVADSYEDRLRPRHHALARLAREGLAPAVVTTNYDLLLEGAYRLAGFGGPEDAPTQTEDVPLTTVPRFSRIAGADQFFAHGDGYRTALILKIHGCADAYRKARQQQIDRPPAVPNAAPSINSWASYLPALVFTYREIQTWRSDAWSRDLIRTLLRTHTLALCGYSGADPVLHSTFREVYEEMARARAPLATSENRGQAQDTTVFCFDIADKREFHSLEILRAATEAAGLPVTKLVEHPNRVEFQIGDKFPTLDDHFRWMTHRVLRHLQANALRSRLRRLAPRLLGRPCPDADYRRLCDAFDAQCANEPLALEDSKSPTARRAFDRVVGWTWNFLPGLLRELALADLVESRRGPGGAVHAARRWPWYFPVSERPEWAAWAAVVELALRNMVGCLAGARADGLLAEASPHAAISFPSGPEQYQPAALCIRLAGYERLGQVPALTGAFRQVKYWELTEQDVPWAVDDSRSCPLAKEIWGWATGETADRSRAELLLGVNDARH